MSRNISKNSNLLMVTDTAMVRKDGVIYAFGPVVRELEVFDDIFENIMWIGFERRDLENDSILLPVPSNIHCTLLPMSGGKSIYKKLGVLRRAPLMLHIILKGVFQSGVIHSRGPSSPALISILISFLFRGKIWWHKYAGDWSNLNPPRFYGYQRNLLKRAKWCHVTINGVWPDQSPHCISFENPCLDNEERLRGRRCIDSKSYDGRLEICFVGALTISKGIDKLLEAIPKLDAQRVSCVHIVGDGPLKGQCLQNKLKTTISIKIHGQLSRDKVGSIMERCHIIVLPSLTEGFPKVIAEGANYGCVPVVSDISAIGQYIKKDENGFLISPMRLEKMKLSEDLGKILDRKDLKIIAENAHNMASLFTFESYYEKISNHILTNY